MTLLPRIILVAVLCLLVAPSVASAQVGQRPDPDSPAGVEYQLPLEQARKNATGAGSSEGPGKATGRRGAVARFGVGIVAAGKGDSTSRGAGKDAEAGSGGNEAGARAKSGASGGLARAGSPDGSEADMGRADQAARSAAVATPESGGGAATLPWVGIAFAVLLAGGLLGLGLRRGLKQTVE